MNLARKHEINRKVAQISSALVMVNYGISFVSGITVFFLTIMFSSVLLGTSILVSCLFGFILDLATCVFIHMLLLVPTELGIRALVRLRGIQWSDVRLASQSDDDP